MARFIARPRAGLLSRAVLALAAASMSIIACGDDDDDGTGEPRAGAGSGGDGAGASGALGGEGGSGEPGDPCRGLALPADAHFVAEGLCARAVALNQGVLRQISFTSNGDLIGVRVSGQIVRYRDVNDDGMFEGDDEIVEIANIDGDNGNNAHVDEAAGFLYAGSPEGVKRWPYSAEMNDLPSGEVVVTGQPTSGTHRFHTVHVYDGFLYVHSGSENNAVAPASPEYDLNRSVLKRFDLAAFESGTPFEWESGEVFVSGVRNMVGFTQNADGDIYGVINGMDNLMYGGEDVHADNPGDDLRLLEAGGAHGYPYCFTASNIVIGGEPVEPGTQLAAATDPVPDDPDFVNPRDDAWCALNSSPPATFLPPHSAPLDLTFFDDEPEGGLPEEFRGGAFVALHGSWNTTPSVGHQVVLVPFENGEPPMPEAGASGTTFPFTVVFGGGDASGAAAGSWGWSVGDDGEDPVRPVGVAISPIDGALYVSSDNAKVLNTDTDPPLQGVLYRIAIAR